MVVPSTTVIVDTIEKLKEFLDAIPPSPHSNPQLFLDLEGSSLSRDGSIAIVQVYVLQTKITYLLDVTQLGKDLFVIKGTSTQSFQDILEQEVCTKVFFDCRNDADALYSHYGICLRGVRDIQLMELASRKFGRTYLNGLAKCVERDLPSPMEASRWTAAKAKGKRLFAPELGGSYEVFSQRPMAPGIIAYCVADADILPQLWVRYKGRLTPTTMNSTINEAAWRVERSKDPTYQPHGKQRAHSNWPWTSQRPPPPKKATLGSASMATTGALAESETLTPGQASDSGRLSLERSFAMIQIANATNRACSDSDGSCEDVGLNFRPQDYDDHEDDDRSFKDFTACSSSDCGFCGQCDY